MKLAGFHLLVSAIVVSLLLVASGLAIAQSQALNGQIEGTVSDRDSAAVTNAVITVMNIETGATRTVRSEDGGVYRFPLLPLGTYRVIAEAINFKKFVREGVTLTTGQIATVDVQLETGDLKEVVTVSADASIADAGKTDLGRVMNTREVQNLPLIPRNPYNFALLQANVTGRPSRGFASPTINANGYLRRVNFLLDGNTNTAGDRNNSRFMIISDTYVSEIQLVTNGFAAEFGNTPGLIMNVVTPSGTNALHGSVSYRFRRPSFYSRPFFYPSATDIPDNKADNFTAAISGPIIKDRWHFYFGYENGKRDDKAAAVRLLTIREEDEAQLIAAGLSPAIFPPAIPSVETGPFYIFRSDAQLNDKNHLTARLNHSDLSSKNFIQGGFNTLERAVDAASVDYSLAAQLASYTPHVLNEFRFQYAQRRGTSGNNGNRRNQFSGTGPSVVVVGAANFGSPANVDTVFPPRRITQIQDNLTLTASTHAFKFGGGFNFYDYTDRSPIFSQYTFSSIANYVAARNGMNRQSYATYVETFGNPEIHYKATFWNFFVQDDWKMTRRLKLNYGLRYDLYQVPKADSTSQVAASQRFSVDQNNFAPRVGLAYALREGERPTILRAGGGIYFDQPLLAMYQRALQNNGSAKIFTLTLGPNSPNAPAFPNILSGSLPPGSVLPQQNIDTISPDFESMYAIHSNIQLEQAITKDLSFAAGYVHSAGRHLPVYRDINLINPIAVLADGRGVFSSIINATTRRDPRFNIVQMVESAGTSRYDAFVLQLTERLARGLQFSANYTLSKATDDAPEQNMTTAGIQGLVLSDPYNRRLDKGSSFADQHHTFVMSLVAHPQFRIADRTLRYLCNHNQVGIIATANSGETFNIVSNSDLNRDGIFGGAITNSDRPVGIKRNSGTTPPQYNVDLRYSRFFSFTERYQVEVFGEFQNLFNINSIVQFNNVTVTANALTGQLVGELPDFKARNQSTSQDSRQFQIGIKFIF